MPVKPPLEKQHETVIVKIPFEGFYESKYSREIDHIKEREIECLCDPHETDSASQECYWPAPLQIPDHDLGEIFIRVTNYPIAYEKVAAAYVETFDELANEAFGFALGARFESMSSPRFYNYETDLIFAEIPLASIYRLWRLSRADNHATLRDVIRRRFTHRDGFISHYSAAWVDWRDKPLRDWDHNELEALLIAAFRLADHDLDDDQVDWSLFESMIYSDETFYSAWQEAFDWKDFESRRLDARATLLFDWLEDDPDAVLAWRANNPDNFDAVAKGDADMGNLAALIEETFDGIEIPYRCPHTADLFTAPAG